jgi:glycosyltransferase involved in cell wall biosynthesis
MTDRLRVLVAFSYSTHYRLGVLRALLEDPDTDVDVAAGVTVLRHAPQQVAPIDPAALPQLRLHRTYAVRSLRWQPGLLRQSLSEDYDVVVWDPSLHCLTMWASSLALRARRDTTLVYWGLGWTAGHGPVKERVKVAGFRLAHGFLTYGRRSAERAVEAGYPADRIFVVGNSTIDTQEAAAVAAAPMPPLRPLSLVVSLRLTARKRVDLLLQAAAALDAAHTPTRVQVIGDGPERAALEALARRLGVDATFHGALYDPGQIADVYRQAHVTVIPGHAGLTVTQSLMHGRPVVTHGNTERHAAEWEALRDGVTGSFFREGDVDDLVAHLREVAGWVATRGRQVAADCREDYLTHGDPTVHAHRILRAARRVHLRRVTT